MHYRDEALAADDPVAALNEALATRFDVEHVPVRIGDRDITIARPRSYDDLIDEKAFVEDDRLPYWVTLWPAARALGEHASRLRGNGRTALELGCGCGLVATMLAGVGFRVTASDYYDDALSFAWLNIARNTGVRAELMLLDWRALPATLPSFELVVASDVLYERQYGALVAKIGRAHV